MTERYMKTTTGLIVPRGWGGDSYPSADTAIYRVLYTVDGDDTKFTATVTLGPDSTLDDIRAELAVRYLGGPEGATRIYVVSAKPFS